MSTEWDQWTDQGGMRDITTYPIIAIHLKHKDGQFSHAVSMKMDGREIIVGNPSENQKPTPAEMRELLHLLAAEL